MTKAKHVTIGLIQSKVSDDVQQNVAHTANMVVQAVKKGAKIICLQELFQTPYFPQWEKMNKNTFAETLEGVTISEMQKIAKHLKVTLVVPFYQKLGKKYFNTAAVISKTGKIMGEYHKAHIPHDPGFYEKEYFEYGQQGYKVFEVDGVKFAVLICYDQWFPEAAREVRLQGAEIIFYPTAIGNIVGYKEQGDWHNAWETVMRGHAIANSLYVTAINRTGQEGKMKFWGQSFIADPFGKVIKSSSPNKEEVLVQKLDLNLNTFYSEGWGFMRNRRPETYKTLTKKLLIKKGKQLQKVAHYVDQKRILEGK